jgi:hypothetical protein
VNPRHRYRYLGVCLIAAIASAACRDSTADPMALILSEDTWGVLAAEGHLPSLGALVAESAAGAELAEVAQRWSSSWELPTEAGRAIRGSTYDQAAGPLAAASTDEAVAAHVTALGEVLGVAAELDGGPRDGSLSGSLEGAVQRHQEAVSDLASGRRADALRHTLQGADLLRELGPDGVTRMLIARAESELERRSGGGDLSASAASEELLRGQRLIRGAHQALESGDYLRAIQRAYYACQVLGLGSS